jgi:GNAT superfamily N-acetyltransferase
MKPIFVVQKITLDFILTRLLFGVSAVLQIKIPYSKFGTIFENLEYGIDNADMLNYCKPHLRVKNAPCINKAHPENYTIVIKYFFVKPVFRTENCFARRLKAEDGLRLQALCEQCADYTVLIEGRQPDPGAAQNLFRSIPEGKDYRDKFLLGLWSAFDLIGVMDVIRNYPETGIWFIGLLILRPDQRGRGTGQAIIQAFENWAASSGALHIRLTVAKENEAACRFWRRVGFSEIGKVIPMQFGNKLHQMIVMSRDIRAGN